VFSLASYLAEPVFEIEIRVALRSAGTLTGEEIMPSRQITLMDLISRLTFIFVFAMFSGVVNAQQTGDLTKPGAAQSIIGTPGTIPAAAVAALDNSIGLEKVAPAASVSRSDAREEVVAPPLNPPPPAQCKRTIKADVVALAQPIMLNRIGAAMPGGMIFALKRDTVNEAGTQLKADKRPRPLVLRANVGDCLTITFTNSIPASAFAVPIPSPAPSPLPTPSFNTSEVSLHIQGMEWVAGSQDDGSFVGKNNSSLASVASPPVTPVPPQTQTYTLFAKAEGTYLLYTMGDTTSLGLQLANGLFGALNVQPEGAEWYRSQVSADDLALATYNANRSDQVPPGSLTCLTPTNCTFTLNGKAIKVLKTPDFGSGGGITKGGYLNTLDSHPLIDYGAVYPAKRLDGTSIPADLVGTPILNMLDAGNNIVHTDLTAMITGPNAGRFPGTTGTDKPEPPCNSESNPALNPPPGGTVDPLFCQNPASPDRKQPYREITILYHGGLSPVATQAFPILANTPSNPMAATTLAGQDAFAINYGTGGIGAEIFANRIGVGPMGPCADCKFEEFFLSAWSVGDPAMLVDRPANATPVQKATKAFFPDDPSNVYHSYINDHVKFRILHGGRDVTHVHHQHAHQWLQSPNSDQGSYLDSQMISPGASYTLEMVYNGSGNRNKVVGDSIFHCHFYPHFAAGMWAMWRTHDVFESGTFVDDAGLVVPGSRALPDGEIITGTATPAIVPLPTLPMAPLPAYAQIQNNVQYEGELIPYGGQVVIGGTCQSNQINGLDVIGGCTNGQKLNGTVIDSQYDHALKKMVGQFQRSPGNKLLNPGFPYFIPGIAGARAPHPPLDFAPDAGGFMDGGLPRHIVTGGTVLFESHDQFDWSKDLATMKAIQLPELGTGVEQAAMSFFGNRCYPTFFPDGTAGSCPSSFSTPPQSTLNQPPTGFVLNGLPRKNPGGNSAEQLGAQPGAPFADPAIDDNGVAVGSKRTYKAAAIQVNVTLNKKPQAWHYPQQRMLTLWQDVRPTIDFTNGKPGRQPEPLFFRGNSGDIIEYWHTNLVPNYYLVDDFQVRTPTDILGQHIHLVKFDVTSSDGAGNGFNYEDGTFSPEEVQEIIHAIKAPGGNWTHCAGCSTDLRNPQPPPADICAGPLPQPPQCTTDWLGAQTTIQRWYLDPLVDNSAEDRTLRTVFTHDHFGPSTHQQVGLYAGLLVEPAGSTWTSNDGVDTFGTRPDGGPTSWQARILTSNADNSYREFMLEFQDLQLAYSLVSTIPGSPPPITQPSANKKKGWIDPAYAINAPSGSMHTARPSLISSMMDPNLPPPGTQSVNYVNEPLGFRVGQFADLSYAYDNSIQATVNPLNKPDPLTPLLRAYQNDKVQVRLLVGAHVFSHQFNLEGPTWFAEPSWKNSGYRSAQAMGLSEHFELLFKVPSSSAPSTGRKCPDLMSQANCADYLYSPSLDSSGLANGLWGIFRAYDPTVEATALKPLPNNPVAPGTNVAYSTCPATLTAPAVKRVFNITAVTTQKALASQSPFPGVLVYNRRGDPLKILYNNLGVVYVRTEDLVAGKLKAGAPVEPLILRANAGDCIEVNLTNDIAPTSAVFSQPFSWAPPFKSIPAQPNMSKNVGLHPQLLSYDAAQSNGINVGWNRKGQKDQVVGFGKMITYQWYAGKIDRAANGSLSYTPVEFGALNLFPSDPLFQHLNGLFGSMIIEPAGSSWECGEPGSLANCDPSAAPPATTRASATVTLPGNTNKFREFAMMISDDVRIVNSVEGNSSAVNYRVEPWQFRYAGNATKDFSCMLSNQLLQPNQDPQTPIFRADPGDQVRFHLTHPFGTGTSQVFSLHGHAWQRNPYQSDSKVLGSNNLSQWLGSRDNHGSSDHFDLLIDKAGGEGGKAGDYLYTVFVPNQARQGAWGIFRVGNSNTPMQPNGACKPVKTPGYVPPKPNDDADRFSRRSPNSPSP
jgi:hypothetical protein